MNQEIVALPAQWPGKKSCPAVFWLAITYACVFTRGGTAISAEPHQQPKRVLILFAVNTILPVHLEWEHGICSALQAGTDGPLDIDMEFADLLRFEEPVYAEKLISLLRQKYSNRKIDVVIPVYDEAFEFIRRYGQSVFPGAAVVFCTVHQDAFDSVKLGQNVTGVTCSFDFDGTLELARTLWPQTRHVAVIAGVDASGRRIEGRARRAFAKYSPELEFTYFSGTPIEILQDEVQRLPSDTVIFVLSYVKDSRGTTTTTPNIVSAVSRVANAPVFGFHETLFGHGLLGGHLLPIEKQGWLAGEMAVRVLHGEDPTSIPITGAEMHEYLFDWRELRRWRIPESSLPAGSTVRYREPNLWDLYKYYLLGVIGLVVVQSLLIVKLLLDRRRRQRAEAGLSASEEETRALKGRLLMAQEDERKRLARELHDDVSQQLACAAIEAGKLKQLLLDSDPVRQSVGNLTDELDGIAEDVHRISRQLHPSILDDLGLKLAPESECNRFSERNGVQVRCTCRGVPTTLPSDAALCIYRIAQEALRNAVKHSGAHEVDVSLTADAEYLYLSVEDTGRGFDIREARGRAGLGLASMDERARLVGGVLTVESQPGQGTRIEARIPLPKDEL
ncbi:MAG: ABC transporter substrate binding protein [Thermoguttaceae bacterium]